MQTNIPKNVVDTFYRYKREILKIKFSGGGNGKITKIENLPKVVKQLERTEEQLCKWFSSDLNSPITFQKAIYLLKGHFTEEQLEDSLEKFIQDFVLCKTCENPETIIGVNNSKIYLKCKCCGGVGEAKSKNRVVEYLSKDISLRDKTLKDSNEKNEKNEKEVKENKSQINVNDDKNYEELRQFILKNAPSLELNILRDKLRVTPKELTVKISYYLLEKNLCVKVHDSWAQYFNDYEKAKTLLDTIFQMTNDQATILNYLFTLYQLDYVSEDNILDWYDALNSETDEELQLKLKVVPFINWLETADEED